MKNTIILIVGTLFLASGCTSTVTLGPQANESEVLGATAGTSGASLTLPLIRGEVSTAPKEEPRK